MKQYSRLSAFLLAALLALGMTACGGKNQDSQGEQSSKISSASSQPEESAASGGLTVSESGRIEGQVYTNDLLGITFTLPEDWVLFDAQATLEIQTNKNAAVFGSSDAFLASMEQGGMEYPFYAESIQEDGSAPANLLVQTAPAAMLQGSSLADYADSLAKEMVAQYQAFGGEVASQPTETLDLNGHEVAIARSRVVVNGEVGGVTLENYQVTQYYSMLMENDILVVTSVTCFNDEQVAQADEILLGMK